MLKQRLIVVICLVPTGIGLIALGGWYYALLVLAFMGIAAWEYGRLFYKGGYRPSMPLLVGGTLALILARIFWGFEGSELLISLLVLLALIVATFQYQAGSPTALWDALSTIGGIMYVGWLGGYLISLRYLPDGLWWTLLVLPAAWLGDSGAYFIGSRFGKHPMAPRISPKKSWEGYAGGVVTGAFLNMLLAVLWSLRAPAITPLKGLWIGLALAVITPLGDLAESMLKRTFNVKDSGTIFPGHGGVLDRIDSWLFAAAIGYYLVIWLG